MHIKKRSLLLLTLGIVFFMTGCGSTKVPESQGGYTYNGIYFGSNFTPLYQQGIADGCETSRGIYTKSHRYFNHNNDYNKGWFLGRKRCRNLLKIDKNGDLVL